MSNSREHTPPALPTLMTPRRRAEANITVVEDASAKVAAQDLRSSLQQQLYEHVHALRHATKSPERYKAAEALCSLGPDATSARSWLACRSVLETALLRDESVHVRKSVARALGELGDKGAQPVLQQALENDQDQFVRMRARDALDLLNGQK